MWSYMGDALKIPVFSLIPIFFTIAISSVAVAAALIAIVRAPATEKESDSGCYTPHLWPAIKLGSI